MGCGSKEPQCIGSLVWAASPCLCCWGVRASPTPMEHHLVLHHFQGLARVGNSSAVLDKQKEKSCCLPWVPALHGHGTKGQQIGFWWRCAQCQLPATSAADWMWEWCLHTLHRRAVWRRSTQTSNLGTPAGAEITVCYILYTPKKV